MSGKLIIVRHGETALNKKTAGSVDDNERLRGWKDVPLDEHGHLQARQLGARFAGMKAHKLATSPLLRASETADRIGEAMGIPADRDKRLMPWNLGDLAGKKMGEVLPVMKMLQATDTRAPNGEKFSEFLKRFLPALKQYLFLAESGQDVVLVTHTRDCQAARAWIAKGMPDDFNIDEKVMDDYAGEVPPCGIMVIGPTVEVESTDGPQDS